jgi:ABC-2 type transport system ATP-binding protein
MLTINNIHYGYKKNQSLFDGLDFVLEPGKISGLLGKNGAGKSTLLRLITGAYFPKQGSLEFGGTPTLKRNVDTLSSLYFLQEDDVLPSYKIGQYVSNYSPFYPHFSESDFSAMLEKFEIDAIQKMKDLSFGQKKKMSVAFALATGVKLLILDEPTNGMDIPSKSILRQVVSETLREDQSIIISTHQIRDLGQLLDTIIVIEKGKILLNEDMYTLSEKYSCVYAPGNTLPEDVLYSEPAPGGNIVLRKNSGMPSDIDIEVFFNAIISNPSILNQ